MDAAMDAPMNRNIPSLSMMWGFEDSDLMCLSDGFLEVPDVVPVVDLAINVGPKDAPNLKQPSRKPSLARLKREQAVRMAKQLRQPVDASQQKNGNIRMNAGSKDLFLDAGSVTDSTYEVTGDSHDRSMPLLMASTTCSLPATGKHNAYVQEQADFDAKAPPQEVPDWSKVLLAGAASLGLRMRRNRSASESPAHKSTHPTNNELENDVHAYARSTKAKTQKWLKETNKVPRAPSEPQPESNRKRPLIRGVPVLMISAS